MGRIVLATAAIMVCGLAAAAPLATSHGHAAAPGSRGEATGGGPPANGILYSQNGSDAGIAIVSQNFESVFDQYDARAADDFTLGRKARITEVDVVGTFFNGGPARGENVTFYKNKKGLPGAVIFDFDGLNGAGDDRGSFAIKIPQNALLLPKCCAGTTWVSVQVNMDYNNVTNMPTSGEWGWENQTTVVGHPAAWENPGGGFDTGCTTYQTETTCIPEGQGDHMFTIRGRF